MSKKFIFSNQGYTLIEVLAVVLITSVIGVVTYSILLNGLKTYNITVEEAKLRDEADYLMIHLMDELFTLKLSDIQERKLPDNSNNYFLIKKNGNKTGFDHDHSRVLVNGREVSLKNQHIVLAPESKIIETDRKNVLEIRLVLQSTQSKEKLELKSLVSIIDDRSANE